MVLDTSALAAILFKEPDWEALANALRSHRPRHISTVTYLEATFVVEARNREAGRNTLEKLLRETGTEVIPFDARQLLYACQGWRDFGKGNHPAALNMGDCATYALVKVLWEPLLCKGNDFAQTDIAHLIIR